MGQTPPSMLLVKEVFRSLSIIPTLLTRPQPSWRTYVQGSPRKQAVQGCRGSKSGLGT
jgi:hypothetical protein